MKLSESVAVYTGLSLKKGLPLEAPRGAFTVENARRLCSPGTTAAFFRPLFDGEVIEHMWVVGLGPQNQALGVVHVAAGGFSSCEVDPRVLFSSLLLIGPVTGFVLCHNHPSGDPTPSTHDVAMTRQLAKAGQYLCIRLLDHIVLGDGRWVSMLTEGLMEGVALNPVPKFLQLVAATKGMSIESAATTVACRAPRLVTAVLEEVGSWPNAEPAISALQRLWK